MNKICFTINGKNLYLEQILLSLDYPVLYTCNDGIEIEEKYIVLCTDDSENFEYLIAKTDNEELLKMLEQKLPIRNLFVKNKCYLVQTGENLKNDIIKTVNGETIPEDKLPEKDAMFENLSPQVQSYLSKLKICNYIRHSNQVFVPRHNDRQIHRRIIKNSNNDFSFARTISSATCHRKTGQIRKKYILAEKYKKKTNNN